MAKGLRRKSWGRLRFHKKMERKNTRIVVLDRDDGGTSRLYWREKSAEERLGAVEFLREQFYIIQGHKSVPLIERVLRVMERS